MKIRGIIVFAALLVFSVTPSMAQSTDFVYQGQMQNGAASANGVFDFEFALFGSALGGSQLGSTLTRNSVSVTNGIFSVSLDFGSQFDGSARFLEIRVRQSGGGTFTALAPRQPVASSPYAVRSIDAQNAANATNATNATNAVNLTGPLAGDVTGTQGATTVARLRGTTVSTSAPANGQVLKFNSAANQWQPATDETASGGGGGGTITGVTAGTGLTGGGTSGNVTVGLAPGGVGTTQLADASVTDAKIVGVAGSKVSGAIPVASVPAGSGNYVQNGTTTQASSNFNISGTGTAGIFNAATQYNISGDRILSKPGTTNLFAGEDAGSAHTGGVANSFFGAFSGRATTTGGGNSFFGQSSGNGNTIGSGNTFFGLFAGAVNISGTSNTAIGRDANLGASNLTNATAIGANAVASTSNSLVLGSIDGVNGATANTNVGIGTNSPTHLLTVGQPETTIPGTRVGIFSPSSFNVVLRETANDVESFWALNVNNGALFGTSTNHALDFRTNGLQRMAIAPTGEVALTTLGAAGATTLCRNASNQIATCSGGGVPAGSNNYIQNGTVLQNADFVIGGVGTAGIFNSISQYQIGSLSVLAAPGLSNLYAGIGAGNSGSTGSDNSFAGRNAGSGNTTGSRNSFFGSNSGTGNTSGVENSFFGYRAGFANTTGNRNAFFGHLAGLSNTVGTTNSFFGNEAGQGNTTAFGNSFFGARAGSATTTGGNNSFFGLNAGDSNISGSNNSVFGAGAGVAMTSASSNAFFGGNAGSNATGSLNSIFGAGAGFNLSTGEGNTIVGFFAGDSVTTGTNNTLVGRNSKTGAGDVNNSIALGNNALVSTSNSLVLGGVNGINGAAADTNVGIGTTSPTNLLTVGSSEATTVSAKVGVYGTAGFNVVLRETTNDVESFWGVNGSSGAFLGTSSSDALGFRTNGTNRVVIAATGEVAVNTLGAAGATTLCRNASNQISSCSSSLKYKTNITNFKPGLSFLNRLQPISFDWKDGGLKDVGFGAEDIAKIDPRFVTYNHAGEVEGVKYDRLSVAFVNAIKEQQDQIAAQARVIEKQKDLATRQQAVIEQLEQRLTRLERKNRKR